MEVVFMERDVGNKMGYTLDCAKIKLVLWDLDDTFWQGTLSEGEVVAVPAHIALVKALTERGIVNSICSKNDRETVLQQLVQMGVADYFVFASINWEPKGARIKALIADMKLREENVLFLDDNPVNLNEAKFYNPEIMIATPDATAQLEQYVKQTEANDRAGKRLQSYRVLEKKHEAKSQSASNEAFLKESNIKVTMETDCLPKLERIAELIQRTNQLNFTKKRISKEETAALLSDHAVHCGYVTVKDKYGEYGIVGFYACRGQQLEHFLFSCRTIGMGIEQYVYACLDYPLLTVVGEVAASLEKGKKPDWINQDKALITEGRQSFQKGDHVPKILFKGPCDLDAIFSFIEEDSNLESEFTYVSSKTGVTIEQISHTEHMVQALTLSEEQKRRVAEELPFGDENMYSDKLFTGGYDVVCISSLVDSNLGVYRRKETGEKVAFAEGFYPLTDSSNWEKYSKGDIYTSGCHFTKELLQEFSRQYEFLGICTPEETVCNFQFIRSQLSEKTLLIIMLGTEIYYEGNQLAAYQNRHIEHKQRNDAIRDWAKNYENVTCIDVNHYITGQESFYDHFNHFVPAVYYGISKDLVRIVGEWTGHTMVEKSKTYLWMETVKDNLRKIKRKLFQ